MKKGDYVVMINEFTTYCGKEYKPGHVGLLREDVECAKPDSSVDVQFPIHGGYGSSSIPFKMIKEADDQKRAKRLFELGKEKERCMMY